MTDLFVDNFQKSVGNINYRRIYWWTRHLKGALVTIWKNYWRILNSIYKVFTHNLLVIIYYSLVNIRKIYHHFRLHENKKITAMEIFADGWPTSSFDESL